LYHSLTADKQMVDLVGKRLSIGVIFDTVTVQIICGSDYEAQVLHDDIMERIRSGEGVAIALKDMSLTAGQRTEET
jgi:hypothetical protein